MNIGELKSSLSWFSENITDVSTVIYSILKNSQSLHKLDIEANAQKGLCNLFLKSITNKIMVPEDITLLQYSSADERKNALYEYDLEGFPDELSCIHSISHGNDIPLLNLQNEDIGNLKALLIQIGTQEKQIILYKILSSVNIFKRDSFFLIKDQTRLKQVDDDFLRISDNFQLMYIEESLVIVELNAVEKKFELNSVIQAEAKLGIQQLASISVLENPDTYLDLLSDLRIAKKLVKIASKSPVIQKRIDANRIINFCKNYPTLKGKFKFNDAGDKIILKSKISKELFLKLLLDNYLTSELTELYYESLAKDPVQIDEVIST